jgi:hypothetical protein
MGSFMVRLWVLLWLGLSFLCKNFSDVIMSSYFFFFEMVHLFYSVLQENCVCVQKKLFSV